MSQCQHVTMSQETHIALQDATRRSDPVAYEAASAGVVQCELDEHDGFDHVYGDHRWNDEPVTEDIG